MLNRTICKSVLCGCLAALLLMSVGCSREFAFPDESVFTLTTNIQDMTVKVGEEINVECHLVNNSDVDYEITRGMEWVWVLFDTEDKIDQHAVTAAACDDIFGKRADNMVEKTFVPDAPGTYILRIFTSFSVYRPAGELSDSYQYKLDDITITVIE